MSHDPHTAQYPPIVVRYWYSIDWDVEALWRLDLPTEIVPMALLAWHLDVPIWPDSAGNPYRVTPRSVLNEPDRHAREHKRVFDADLSYPIEIFPNQGRLMILDGIHRLTRAIHENRREIAARRVPDDAIRHL